MPSLWKSPSRKNWLDKSFKNQFHCYIMGIILKLELNMMTAIQPLQNSKTTVQRQSDTFHVIAFSQNKDNIQHKTYKVSFWIFTFWAQHKSVNETVQNFL